MPGVIMEDVKVEGSVRTTGFSEPTNGISNPLGDNEKSGLLSASVNGTGQEIYGSISSTNPQARSTAGTSLAAFEIPHITQGFFPLGTLINRAVQQCWNDLSELITELAVVQVPSDTTAHSVVHGKHPGNQSSENVHKKVRMLEFAHTKRAEFIKLLVLSQWSRQAAEVSRLIDIQGFIRTRHAAYAAAVQYVGEMKRDLVRAQVANPDLKTALEVLSKGKIASLPDLGYKPPRPLTARATLKKLQKINRIISIRLALYDQVPHSLKNYSVHDGRVTFTVPGEFELDLSVAQEVNTSQFFFVDIRFLFSPSSPVPKGRIFNELDAKINDILLNEGLMGCFDFLHGLVLTNKVNTLFRQATDLSRSLWSDALHIELLHRTLVVQYWPTRFGLKSWLEIGVQRRSRNTDAGDQTPLIGIRWMRDGQQVNSDAIQFDTENLSMEQILRSVIALHTSHLLSAAFAILKKYLLFYNNDLLLRAQLSPTEPGDCYLDVQLTPSRALRVSVEPMSGSIVMSSALGALEHPEPERLSNRSAIDELLFRVSRHRCVTAVEEIELGLKAVGLESVSHRALGHDIRRLFPPNVMRSAFFTHRTWHRSWVVAATSSMDGDSWWLVNLRSTKLLQKESDSGVDASTVLPAAHLISHTFMLPHRRLELTAFAELMHGLTGILAIYANARILARTPGATFHPPLENIQLGPNLELPDLVFSYKAISLIFPVRLALPPGLERGTYLQDSIRIRFHGMACAHQKVALVAYGSLRYRVKALLPLISRMNPLILMQGKGSGFALRIPALAGSPIILHTLFEQLQEFECILSIIQSLIQKGMEPRTLSLSHVTFAYGPENQFSGRFDIEGVAIPTLEQKLEQLKALSISKTDAVVPLRLKVSFDSPSPHCRIQDPLTMTLNQRFAQTGVESIFGLMSDTYPLLRCLDQITTTPPESVSSVVYITVRSPTVFRFHYPYLRSRFQLSARPRQGRMVWVLEDVKEPETSDQNQSPVATAIRKNIYDAKGDGWQGLGDGAVSSLEKIGNLLTEFHARLSACPPAPKQETQGKQPDIIEQSQVAPVVPATKSGQPLQKNGGQGNADVITID